MDRLRTIDKAIDELKASDPECALTEWALRRLVKEGEIPAVMIGSKQLVSIEAIESYFTEQLKG